MELLPAIRTEEHLREVISQILSRVQQAHVLLCKQNNIKFIPPINDPSIISSLALFNIIRLPKVVYQCLVDARPRAEWDRTDAMMRARRIIDGYVEDTFPGMSTIMYADLTIKEAQQLHPNLSWGLYLLLEGEVQERTKYIAGVDPYVKDDKTISSAGIFKRLEDGTIKWINNE